MKEGRKVSVKVTKGFLISLAVICYFNMENVLYPFFISCAVHEFGHFLAMKLMKVEIKSVSFECTGPVFNYCGLDVSYKKEIVIAAAGPLFGFSVSALAARIGGATGIGELLYFGGTGAILNMFNMIPAEPFDGGRILKDFLILKKDVVSAQRIMRAVNITASIFLLAAGAYIAYITRRNFAILAIAIWLMGRYTVCEKGKNSNYGRQAALSMLF